MKFFDIDRFKEILDTLTRNKGRSLLTGFGVFWGIFMLLFLLGGGDGFKVMLNQQMGGFASNSAMIWSQNTSKPYKGFNKGRYWEMNIKDVEILKERFLKWTSCRLNATVGPEARQPTRTSHQGATSRG